MQPRRQKIPLQKWLKIKKASKKPLERIHRHRQRISIDIKPYSTNLERIFWFSKKSIRKTHIDEARYPKPESSPLVIAIFEAGTHFYSENPEKIVQGIAHLPIVR